MKHINDWKRKELMALPMRAWDRRTTYDSVLVISTKTAHDSGWAMMAVIGVNGGVPVEVAARCCDDIEWIYPPRSVLGAGFIIGQVRTDCCMASGAVHFWKRDKRFRVGPALSSLTIEQVDA